MRCCRKLGAAAARLTALQSCWSDLTFQCHPRIPGSRHRGSRWLPNHQHYDRRFEMTDRRGDQHGARPEWQVRSARARVTHTHTAVMSRIAAATGYQRIITAGANGGLGTAHGIKALALRGRAAGRPPGHRRAAHNRWPSRDCMPREWPRSSGRRSLAEPPVKPERAAMRRRPQSLFRL
jgi:hypothetical protein